eukprot:1150521-Pelagomonas_calceolata.AAC.1
MKNKTAEELESDIKRTANDLERAVQTEDYKAASLLKQHLDQLELERLNSNPLLFLQTQLQNAVKEERYKVRAWCLEERGRSVMAVPSNHVLRLETFSLLLPEEVRLA